MKGGLVMPVVVIPYDSRLQLNLVTGTDPESGKPIIKRTYFNNVKESAAEQDIFDVATQLVSLQKDSLDSIELTKNFELTS
ncbi:MAG: hypothetical protein XE08_0113 [Parcubacteria bacterium 32_520]|nr:MAG: hypothetical protein XE08_0113 [Parcubacteria bacterium 32_520]